VTRDWETGECLSRAVLVDIAPLPEPYPPGIPANDLWKDVGYWERLWMKDISEVEGHMGGGSESTVPASNSTDATQS